MKNTKVKMLFNYFKIYFLTILALFVSNNCYSQNCTIWNVPKQVDHFIGRDDISKQLYNSFNKDNSDISVISIYQFGGAGKTQTAIKYANDNKFDNYDIVWWFDSEFDLKQQFTELAKEINSKLNKKSIQFESPKDAVTQTKTFLRTSNLNWLFIFDNATSYEKIINFIPSSHTNKKSHILITSRNSLGWPNYIELPDLTQDEKENLINKITNNKNYKQAKKLSLKLKDNSPLDIEQLSLRIRNSSASFNDILNLLNTGKYMENSSIKSSINKIKKNKQAYDLLMFISMIKAKKIPNSLLTLWCKIHNDMNEYESFNTIEAIREESLLNLENNSFSIHENIQKAAFKTMNEEHTKKIIFSGLKVFLTVSKEKRKVFKPFFGIINEHSKCFCDRAIKLKANNESLYKLLLENLEEHLIRERDLDSAKEYISNIEDHFKKDCKYKYLKGTFLTKKAYILNSTGKSKEGYEILLESTKYISPYKNISEYIKTMTYIARRAIEIGDLSKAEEILINVNKNSKKFGFASDKNSLEYFYNKSLFFHVKSFYYIDAGEYKKSLIASKKSKEIINIFREKTGASGKYSATLLAGYVPQQIAIYLSNTKNHKLESIEFLHSITKQNLKNKNHKIMAIFKLLLGNKYCKENKKDESFKLISEGKDIIDYLYKENKHRVKGFSIKILADWYQHHKEYNKAKKLYLLSESNYVESMKYKKIDEISILYKDIIVNSISRGDARMAQDYIEKHFDTFGLNHPRNKEIANIFASHI